MAISDLSVELSLDTSTAEKKYQKFTQTINKQSVNVNVEMNTGNAEEELASIADLLSEINETIKPKVTPNVETQQISKFKSIWDSIKDKQVKISAIGSGFEKIGQTMENIFSFDSNSKLGKFMSFFTKGIGYSAIYRTVASAQSTLTSAVTEGIQRYDTIKVSKHTLTTILGSTEEASQKVASAIDTITEKIEGLPTTMQEALSHISTFTAINGDIEKSTKLFNAMNDAILTFGGSSDQVDNMVTQYSQIMGSKMDSRTFLSMQSSGMTPVLTAVAKKHNMTLSEFKDAFTGTSPSISLEEFENDLIDLDENGGYGLEKLSDMAKASVQTITNSVALIGTRLNKAFAKITEAFDNTIQKLTGKNIYEIIAEWTDSFDGYAEKVVDWINNNQDTIGNFFNSVKTKADSLMKTLKKFDFKEFIKGITDLSPIIKGIISAMKTGIKAGSKIANVIGGGSTSRGLGKIVATWILLGKAFKIVGKGLQAISPFLAVVQTLNKLDSKKLTTLGKVGKALKNPMSTLAGDSETTETPSFNMDSFKNMLSSHADKLLTVAEVGAMGAVVLEWTKVLKTVDQDLNGVDWLSLAGKLTGVATVIGSFQAFVIGLQKLQTVISTTLGVEDALTIETKIVSYAEMFAEGGILLEFAFALEYFNKHCPKASWNFTKKLGAMGEAIVALSAFAGGLGALNVVSGGIGGIAVLTGLIEIVGEGGVLYILATSLEKIGKLKFDKISPNIDYLSDSLDDISELCKNAPNVDASKLYDAKNAMVYVASMGESLAKLDEVKDLDADNISSNVKAITSVLENVNWGNLNLSSTFDSSKAEATVETLKSIAEIPSQLKAFQTNMDGINPDAFTSKKDGLIGKFQTITEAFYNSGIYEKLNEIGTESTDVTQALTAVQTMQQIMEAFKTFASSMQTTAEDGTTTDIDTDAISAKIESFRVLLSKLVTNNNFKDGTLTYYLSELSKYKDKFTNVKDAVSALNDTVDSFQGISAKTISVRDIQTVMSNVETCVKKMNEIIQNDFVNDIGEKDLNDNVGKVKKYTDKFISMVTKLNELQGMTVDSGAIINLSNQINHALQNMAILSTDEIDKITSSIDGTVSITEKLTSIVTELGTIATNESVMNVGSTLATTIVDSFINSDKWQELYAFIDTVAQTIASKTESFKSAGKRLGSAIVKGIKESLSSAKYISSVTSSLTSEDSLATAQSAGATVGSSIMSGITSNLKNVTISKTTTKKNKNGKSSSSTETTTVKTAVNNADGGLIYRENGGKVGNVAFLRQGTDTVPAMLTPGEFVIKRSAVQKYGVNFFDRLNSMDMKGAVSSLKNGFSTTNIGAKTYNVVNNKTINNYDNRSVSVTSSTRGNSDKLKAGRFMRALA